MSTIKSLILGSAAVIAASAGAQAADLPVKAKAVQYVKICSLYGAGFYYIPGTDTCIKLGGYVQADANINAGNYGKPGWDEGGFRSNGTGSRDSDLFTTRSRVQLNIDTRTATEYGVVRTFWSSNFEHSTGFGPSSGNLTMDYGFVQFAGFTFGKAVSGFQTPWGAYGANNNNSFLLGGYDNATGITQIAYTWQFGNGISAQIGLEDNRVINRAQLLNASTTFATGLALTAANTTAATSNAAAIAAISQGVWGNSYGGNVAPDVTANVRVDQAAFTFQLSGALHTINGNYYANGNPASGATVVEPSGNPETKVGGAISAGIQLKNLPTGPGDKLSLDGTWSKGATKYIISGVTGNSFDHFSGGDNGFYNNFASNALFDAVYGTGGSLELTTAWGFRGAYVHNWSPTWESSVFGSYSKVDYNTNASANICAAQARAVAGIVSAGAVASTQSAGFSCNPDFAIWQIGTRTAWTPVKNLTFSGEVMYTGLDQSNVGSLNITAGGAMGTFKPAGAYEYKDQGIWSGNLRVRRTW
ncbi:porin [soil metagenome]